MFGAPVSLEVTDEDGQAVDLTAHPTITVVVISPDQTAAREWSGTGDSLGGLTFTPASDSTFDRPGNWQGQVEFADSTSVLIMSPVFDVPVDRRLGT